MSIDAFDKESINRAIGKTATVYAVFKLHRNWLNEPMGNDTYIGVFVRKEAAEAYAHECQTLNKLWDGFEVRETFLRF